MKVGLLTLHKIYNAGSILQAYATQVLLDRVGASTEIIDYKYPNKTHSRGESTWSRFKRDGLSRANAMLKRTLPGRPDMQYRDRYREARDSWYRTSELEYESRVELLCQPPTYEAYVVGSDQVWHPRTAGRDSTFLLDFAENLGTRFSYASSFGSPYLPTENHAIYRSSLADFDAISVREESGVEIVRLLTGRTAELVLDPTLMVASKDWKREARSAGLEEPYILCYGSNPGNNYMERLATHLGRQTGYRVCRVHGNFFNYFDRNIEHRLDIGPREWLDCVANASLVIGQSFHATAFAVHFGRPFVSLLTGRPGRDSRQLEFLSLLGLEDHALTSGDPLPDIDMLPLDVPEERVQGILRSERARSESFLRQCLA